MKKEKFYAALKDEFLKVLTERNLNETMINVTAKMLSPEEAIGTPTRKDFPLLTGKDIMIEANFLGTRGQAFTDAPTNFAGSISEILTYDLETDPYARGLLIASINAVMGHIEKAENVIHCKNNEPENCARYAVDYLQSHYDAKKILVVGYQPALIENLCKTFDHVRALDLNPENIGARRFGIVIESGESDMADAIRWADLILCTGSAICNGTITDYLELPCPTLFFGTTLAGAAALLNLPRLCFADRVSAESDTVQ